MNVLITRLRPDATLPEYMSEAAAGMDVCACIDEPIIVPPGKRAMVATGFAMAMPDGFEAQVRPRSGRAWKEGLTVVNAPGTIDSDYRGEVKILLVNLGDQPVAIRNGDRIAQMVVAPVTRATLQEVDALPDTVRGAGGFGSTGFVLLLAASLAWTACKNREPVAAPPPAPVAVPVTAPAPVPAADAAPVPAPEAKSPCPAGMAVATDGTVSVCIDKYEFPGYGRMPETDITQDDASTRCTGQGKRLCSEAEWRAACRGPSQQTFPYGDGYLSTTCNTSLGKPAALVAAGTFVECKSAAEVYDLAGNAAEWIASESETMGGSAAEGDDGRCATKDKRTKPRDVNVGFRCCMTPRVGL